jgi:XisH protein
MPAKDIYHDAVREALEKEGWLITHDPYFIRLGKRRGFIDLGAEIIGAEKGLEKIAVEVKSFLGASDVDEFEDALGQFLVYKMALEYKEPNRILYLAMPSDFHKTLFDDSFFVEILRRYQVNVIVYKKSTIELWIK